MQTGDVSPQIVPLTHAIDERRRQAPRKKHLPARDRREPLGQCVGIAPREEKAGHAGFDGLLEASSCRSDHRNAAHDRLDHAETKWLRPQGRGNEGPGASQLSLDLVCLNPSGKRHCGAHTERFGKALELCAIRAITEDG